jgi:hypothetical protein
LPLLARLNLSARALHILVCALRGHDAVHLASAEAILDEGDSERPSDRELAGAARSLGHVVAVPDGP